MAIPTPVLEAVVYGGVMSALEMLGLAGNLLILVALRGATGRGRTITYFYLYMLAVVDLAALVFWLPQIARKGWRVPMPPEATYYFATVGYELINLAFTANSLLTVAITVERFVAVAAPHRAGRVFTMGRAAAVVAACWVVALLAELPDMNNVVVVSGFDPATNTTAIRTHYRPYTYANWYKVTYSLTRMTLCRVLPTIAVCVLNVLVLVKFRAVNARRRAMKAGSADRDKEGKRLREERKLLVMLACVSLIFLLDNIPMSTYLILYQQLTREQRYHAAFQAFRAAANTLEVVNASANFYTFCAFSSDFRRMLAENLGVRKRHAVITVASVSAAGVTRSTAARAAGRAAWQSTAHA